jgi:SAM-dependent methyltransferase
MDVTKQHLAHIEAIEKLSARWARYLTANIDKTIAPNDDMFVAGELDHYLFVGISALQVVSEAMLLAPKTELPKILDLPCGFGRATRHFVKFFPDSDIFVSEIDKEKQAFASTQFHAQGFDVPPDFLGEPADRFDLIFVGSLFTHLNEDLSINALRYLTTALSEGELLIFTTHGRYATMVARNAGPTQLHPETSNAFLSEGFGYQGGPTYGASFMAPSWVLRVLEAMLGRSRPRIQGAWLGATSRCVHFAKSDGLDRPSPGEGQPDRIMIASMSTFLRRPRRA